MLNLRITNNMVNSVEAKQLAWMLQANRSEPGQGNQRNGKTKTPGERMLEEIEHLERPRKRQTWQGIIKEGGGQGASERYIRRGNK